MAHEQRRPMSMAAWGPSRHDGTSSKLRIVGAHATCMYVMHGARCAGAHACMYVRVWRCRVQGGHPRGAKLATAHLRVSISLGSALMPHAACVSNVLLMLHACSVVSHAA